MRIGIFTHYIDKYPKSAPSLYQIDLIEKLVEKTNLEIVLIHHKKSNLPIYRMTEETIIPKPPYLREREINKLDLDVIHFNAIPWSWWPSILKLNISSIVTVHGTEHWDDPSLDDYTTPILRIMKRTLEKQVAKYITHFVAISGHVRDVLLNKLKVPSSQVEVVYLPIDHSVFRPLSNSLVKGVKAKYGIKSRYILHVSAFSRRKNPRVLLRAFYMVRKQTRDVILIIVGSSWNNPFVQKLINELSLQAHVKVLGWIPKEDLVALYNGAEVLLLPSLHENFGFPIVEAMACECPVVASNAYAIPEIVGDAAILCDPYNYSCFASAILKILSDTQTREELVKRGLERAKLFNWNAHIDRIVDVYSRVASKFR